MADDALVRLRALCTSLPEVTERLSHGEPTWFVRGKRTFAMLADHHHDDRSACWLAAPPGAQQALVASDPQRFFVPPYVGHRGWVGVSFDVPEVDWDELGDLVEDAYRVVAPKRLVTELDEARRTSAATGGPGPFDAFAPVAGPLTGRARLWFEPGPAADDEPVTATLVLGPGARWAELRYRTRISGEAVEGVALAGADPETGTVTVAWIDEFHTGSTMFISSGRTTPGGQVDVATTYGVPGEAPWGWRTTLEVAAGALVVRHHNVPPDGEEVLAVELVCRPPSAPG